MLFFLVGVFLDCEFKVKIYYCRNFILCNLDLGVVMEFVEFVLVILIFIGILSEEVVVKDF